MLPWPALDGLIPWSYFWNNISISIFFVIFLNISSNQTKKHKDNYYNYHEHNIWCFSATTLKKPICWYTMSYLTKPYIESDKPI